LTVGDTINLKVLDIDETSKKMRLSYKAIKEKKINRHYEIGFVTIENKMEYWIDYKQKEMKRNE